MNSEQGSKNTWRLIRFKKLDSRAEAPRRATSGSGAWDLVSIDSYEIGRMPVLVRTGIAIEIPDGYCGLVIPRSGLAAKGAVTITNSPGLIDSDYRGEVKVILQRPATQSDVCGFRINRGDRVAQLLVMKVPEFDGFEDVGDGELSGTERGGGGFGSTGR